jgi:hypothetical protein
MESHAMKDARGGCAVIDRPSRRWVAASLLAAVFLPAGALFAQEASERPGAEELKKITLEGRRIAFYHEAIAKTRALFDKQAAEPGGSVQQVLIDRGGTWHVLFLAREMQAGVARGWMTVADAVFQPRVGEVDRLQLVDPPKPAPTDAQAYLMALDAARIAAKAHAAVGAPPYDEAVFGDQRGVLTVYLQSRAQARGVTRFASDVRLSVNRATTQVAEVTPLHGPGEAVDVLPGDGKEPTLHTHASDPLPTPTDVALVIQNPGVAPHLVLTPLWIFRIDADGGLTWLGRNQEPPVAPGGGS